MVQRGQNRTTVASKDYSSLDIATVATLKAAFGLLGQLGQHRVIVHPAGGVLAGT